jgi:cullin-associated NEDD8-dissociated protein 1
MYTLLETCLDKVDVYAFLDRVKAGLEDQHEIKVLAHLMIIRLAHVAPTAVEQSTCLWLPITFVKMRY